MALRGAVASGNWSNPATWNGGVLPSPGDVVASNNFTVTIDQDINVDSLTNAAVTDSGLVPTMTSDTTPSGVVSASSVLNTSLYQPWKAFDKNNSTGWASTTAGPPQWLEYEFPSPTVVDRYVLLATNTDAPVTWEFQAWDGSSWVVLQSIVNAPKVSTPTTYNFTNTTAYSRYRMYMLAPYSQGYMFIHELTLANSNSLASAVAGGGFILNDEVTVTCTNSTYGITSGTGTCVTYAGTGTSTINAHVLGSTTGSNTTGIRVTGTGILNINGNLYGYLVASDIGNTALTITANATVNIVGNVRNPNRYTIYISNQCTLNIIGDVYLGTYNANSTIYCLGTNSVINVTGNIYGLGGNVGWSMTGIYLGVICTLNVTGNLIGSNTDSRSHSLIAVAANAIITVIGTMQSGTNGISDFGEVCFTSSVSSYLNHIGSLIASRSGYALYSIGTGAINLMTGPFIGSDSGMQPLYVARMHYRRTIGSYYEFRDNSTLGALSPSPPAPATRLVSPDTVADSPIPRDVRQGVVYAEGSQTGTMIVPSRDNVAKGVLVDNTTGTAILDADSIWAVPLTSINTLNSIGRRVKNAATVESTGAQIQQTLNNNE